MPTENGHSIALPGVAARPGASFAVELRRCNAFRPVVSYGRVRAGRGVPLHKQHPLTTGAARPDHRPAGCMASPRYGPAPDCSTNINVTHFMDLAIITKHVPQ